MSRVQFALALAAASLGAVLLLGRPAPTLAEEERDQKALVRQGAREWSAYCGSCHNARPQSECSPGEWDTIMLHMRVRANLPARDAEALLAYLKSR